MSLPEDSGVEFAIFIVTLHTMQVRRSISGLLSSFALFTPPQALLDKSADGIGATSVGVRDLSLTVARLAPEWIDFTTWLRRLLHDRVARSITGRADMLFDLRTFHAAPIRSPFR
jgi:hypothetical protein